MRIETKIIGAIASLIVSGCGGESNIKSTSVNEKEYTLKEDFHGSLMVNIPDSVINLNGFSVIGEPSIGIFNPKPPSTGININAKGVKVHNGNIEGFLTGINIVGKFGIPERDNARKIYSTKGVVASKEYMDSFYGLGADNVTIENVNIKAYSHGIYINPFTSSHSIVDSEISNSRIGIYMDTGVKGVRLDNNLLEGNGQKKYSSSLNSLISTGGSVDKREGIAVDGSFSNVFTNNHFKNNALAGISIYTNCWEHWGESGSYPRLHRSSENEIYSNTFDDEVGVWVGSRQKKDLSNWNCGSPEKYGRYYLDYANKTTIRFNTFLGDVAAIISGDDTEFTDNNIGSSAITIDEKADGELPVGLSIQKE